MINKTDVTVHDATPTLLSERPWNSISVTLDLGQGVELTLFCRTITGWLEIRQGLKKHEDYYLSPTQNGDAIRDHDEADEWVRENWTGRAD